MSLLSDSNFLRSFNSVYIDEILRFHKSNRMVTILHPLFFYLLDIIGFIFAYTDPIISYTSP